MTVTGAAPPIGRPRLNPPLSKTWKRRHKIEEPDSSAWNCRQNCSMNVDILAAACDACSFGFVCYHYLRLLSIVHWYEMRTELVWLLIELLRWLLERAEFLQFLANVNSRSRSLYAISRPSVVCCLSVCDVGAPYSVGWTFRQFFSPYDSSATLLFCCQKSLVGDAPFPLKFAFKVTHPLKNSAIVPVKFNFSRKKSATKFLCMKTSSGKVVATSFPYPTVHRSTIRATSPSTWNWPSKWRTPSENADFWSFCLTELKPWQLARILSATEI